MSIKSMMRSNHLLLFPTSSPAFNLFQHQGLFQWVCPSYEVAKYWSFSISPSKEYSGFISFRINWFGFLAVRGTLKSLLQHQDFKTLILWHSAFFMVPRTVKASAYNVGDLSSIPRSGRSPGEGNGNPLSTLTWKTPWMEKPGRLQSMG